MPSQAKSYRSMILLNAQCATELLRFLRTIDFLLALLVITEDDQGW